MNKRVLMTIKPEHWENIKNGRKSLEMRLTKPKDIEYPFIVIVCTSRSGGEVVGSFICNGIISSPTPEIYKQYSSRVCVSPTEMEVYALGRKVHLWDVSGVEVFPPHSATIADYEVKRAPQSWQYIIPF